MSDDVRHARQLIAMLNAREWIELFPYDWMTEQDKTERVTVVVQAGLEALRLRPEEVKPEPEPTDNIFERLSFLCGREITRFGDLVPIEVETLLRSHMEE